MISELMQSLPGDMLSTLNKMLKDMQGDNLTDSLHPQAMLTEDIIADMQDKTSSLVQHDIAKFSQGAMAGNFVSREDEESQYVKAAKISFDVARAMKNASISDGLQALDEFGGDMKLRRLRDVEKAFKKLQEEAEQSKKAMEEAAKEAAFSGNAEIPATVGEQPSAVSEVAGGNEITVAPVASRPVAAEIAASMAGLDSAAIAVAAPAPSPLRTPINIVV